MTSISSLGRKDVKDLILKLKLEYALYRNNLEITSFTSLRPFRVWTDGIASVMGLASHHSISISANVRSMLAANVHQHAMLSHVNTGQHQTNTWGYGCWFLACVFSTIARATSCMYFQRTPQEINGA